METLTIIAYKQPITRGEIESIRGVSVKSNYKKFNRTQLDKNYLVIKMYLGGLHFTKQQKNF